MKTLVVGCDASGKSTMVRRLCSQFGSTSIESSRSPAALTFKTAHARQPIDAAFIDERETFYLQLEAEEQPKTLSLTGDIVTTNATLVTRLSHAVMRTCIGAPGLEDPAIITLWQDDERSFGTPLPDNIILTRAEPDTIRERMLARQDSGTAGEDFWGFNSPFFLERYQERWESILPNLGALGICCSEMDTSQSK
jgi:GTPase SAR1 family protein